MSATRTISLTARYRVRWDQEDRCWRVHQRVHQSGIYGRETTQGAWVVLGWMRFASDWAAWAWVERHGERQR